MDDVEKNLVKKMIRNCFRQYQHDLDSIPLSEEEYEKLAEDVLGVMSAGESDLFEVVNDVVYEYLSR